MAFTTSVEQVMGPGIAFAYSEGKVGFKKTLLQGLPYQETPG